MLSTAILAKAGICAEGHPPAFHAPFCSPPVRCSSPMVVKAMITRCALLSSVAAWAGLTGLSGCSRLDDTRATPAAVHEQAPARLGLNLERVGANYRLSWDRRAPAIAGASRAALMVWNGQSRRDVEFDIANLRAGSILYTPDSEEGPGGLVFRLEVSGRGVTEAEWIMYLNPRGAPSTNDSPHAEPRASPLQQAAGSTVPAGDRAAASEQGAPAHATDRGPATTDPERMRGNGAETEDAISRMRVGLRDPRFRFRTIRRLAVLGGVTEETAVALLRSQTDVVLSVNEAGRRIARLASR